MKFIDPNKHGSKVTEDIKKCNVRKNVHTHTTNFFKVGGTKIAKMQRAVTSLKFYGIPPKVNQLIYTSSTISAPNISNSFCDILLTR